MYLFIYLLPCLTGLASTTSEWCRSIVDSAMNADNEVSEAAFAAVVAILEEDEAVQKLEPTPTATLLSRVAGWCLHLIKGSLGSLLDRARTLETSGQVQRRPLARENGSRLNVRLH